MPQCCDVSFASSSGGIERHISPEVPYIKSFNHITSQSSVCKLQVLVTSVSLIFLDIPFHPVLGYNLLLFTVRYLLFRCRPILLNVVPSPDLICILESI